MSDERAVLESLIARFDADSPPSNAHAQADLLAAYETGALSETEVDVVERWLAEDSSLRSAWLTLRAGAADTAQPQRPARSWRRPLIAAAVLLAAFGTWRWLEDRGTTPASTMEERLARREAALRAGDAPWLQPLQSLTDTVVPTQERPVYRDGLQIFAPHGKQLQGRPIFRFKVPPGASDLTLRVEAEESGAVLLERELSGSVFSWPTELPELNQGKRYLWFLTARTAAGVVDATVPFEIASAQEASRMAALLRGFAEGGDDEDRLLAIVIAYDHGFVDEALHLGARLPSRLQEAPVVQRVRKRILQQGAPAELWPQ